MDIIEVPIVNLKSWPKNSRKVSQRGLGRLKEQIKKLGLYKPMIGYRDGEKVVILGGNTRLGALIELMAEGFKDIDYDKIKVCLVSPKTEEEKLEINISDNDNVGYYDHEFFLTNIGDFNLNEIESSIYNIQSENFEKWLRNLEEEDKKNKTPDDPQYPITKKMHEKYGYVVIFTTNDTDLAYLEQFFDLMKHKSHRLHKWLGITRVIDFEQFDKSIQRHATFFSKKEINENNNSLNE